MSAHVPGDSEPVTRQASHGHDWHSTAYVGEWIAMKEATTAERKAQFELLADFLPYPREAAIHFLDVGAGWGPLTTALLDRFPAAHATLVDYSEAMAAEAQTRMAAYAARMHYVVRDLTQPGALAALAATDGPFHAVVSCCCFHNIDPVARVQALYREAREALTPGGALLDLDEVGTDEPIIRDITHHARVEQRRRRAVEETGRLPPYATIDAELRARRENPYEGSHGPVPEHRSLADHLTWLQDAGFDVYESFWRQGSMVLVGGYVAPAPRSAT